MKPQRTIVVTGASGVVGRSILRELAGTTANVIGLAHRGQLEVEGVRVLRCDVSQPGLGMDPADYADLVRDTDVVIHSGALTEWGQPAERYQSINVEGTRNVTEFAASAQAVVHLISTSFVAALADNAPATLSAENVVANYIHSKRESEKLLRNSGLPYAIYRPTNLIGDYLTGETIRGQIVQVMSDWVSRGRAKVFPAHPGNLIDIVPQDLLSKSVVRAIELGDSGGEYWVTFGPDSMTVPQAIEVCMEHARKLGRQVNPPRIVHPDELDEALLASLPPMSQAFVKVLIDVSEVTACSGGVLPTSMPQLRERYGLPEVSDVEAYRRTLEYWAEHGA